MKGTVQEVGGRLYVHAKGLDPIFHLDTVEEHPELKDGAKVIFEGRRNGRVTSVEVVQESHRNPAERR